MALFLKPSAGFLNIESGYRPHPLDWMLTLASRPVEALHFQHQAVLKIDLPTSF